MSLLVKSSKGSDYVKGLMANHYSQPRGFVGRQLIYEIVLHGEKYGAIAAGSATRFLPGRSDFFGRMIDLNGLVNNIFFHMETDKVYPVRNFTSLILKEFRKRAAIDWENRYGDRVIGWESLVELPRTGEIYVRDKWEKVGVTKGYTCKRTAGRGTDSWTGRRVWETKNLRPKLVFCRKLAIGGGNET